MYVRTRMMVYVYVRMAMGLYRIYLAPVAVRMH